MKFSCKTGDMQHTIAIVSRAVGSQQAIPILGNILFQAEGKHCTLSATNLEFSIISHLDADVENEGAVTVPTKAIQNFIQFSLDEEILFESSEGSQLKCFSKKSKTIIAGEPANEYPTITPIQKESVFRVSPGDLLQAIHHTGFASARTTMRPVLSGVYLRATKKELTLVATDSYRLSEYSVPVLEAQGEIACIVPSKVLTEIMTILGGRWREKETKETKETKESKETKGAEEPVEVTVSSQQVEVVSGRTRILSRLIDGTFPDYRQILPAGYTTKLATPLQELLTSVRRMHYFAKESNNNLTIAVSGGELHLKTQKTQVGQDESRITAEVEGGENVIALSSSYLLDFLSHVSGEEVQMEIVDKMHPAVFRIPGVPVFLHLIMPLRMAEE